MLKLAMKKKVGVTTTKKITYSIRIQDVSDLGDGNQEIRDNLVDNEGQTIIIWLDNSISKINILTSSLTLNISHISCGLFELDGFNNLHTMLEKDPTIQGLLTIALKNWIDELKEAANCAFILASTNDSHPKVVNLLNDLASTTSEWRENPNSGNMIFCVLI